MTRWAAPENRAHSETTAMPSGRREPSSWASASKVSHPIAHSGTNITCHSTSSPIRTSGLPKRTTHWVRSDWRNGSPTSSGRTGKSRRHTGPSTRSPTAEKPCESLPERGERHDGQQGATSFRPDPPDHPAPVSPVRRPLQGVRESGGRSGHLRTQDERSPSEAQSRVLFVPVGIHGGQRRGRSLARLDPLPPDRGSSGHLLGHRPRARPRASVPRRQGAVRRWLRVPRSADGNRSLPDVHRRGSPAGDDGPRVVRLLEGRVDERQGRSAARPERRRAAAPETSTRCWTQAIEASPGSLERTELRLFRLRPLQVGDTDAHETNSVSLVGKLGREIVSDLGKYLLAEDMRWERPLPEVRLKSFETNLDADGLERRPLAPGTQEHVVGDVSERLLDEAPLRHVAVKGPLDADRFRIGTLLHGELFQPARDGPEPDGVLAEHFLQLGARKAGEFPNRPDAGTLEELRGFHPDPANLRDREWVQEPGHLLGTNDLQAVRLRQIGYNLGDRFVGPGTNRACQALPLAHGGLHAGGVLGGAVEVPHLGGDIEERLVDAHMFEDIGVGPQDVHHALRDRPVEFVVRSEIRRRRSLPPGHANWHSTSDSDLSGLVARRHHDAPSLASFRVRADNHWLAHEVWVLAPLDADVECVHVHVENHARHVDPSARWPKDLANRHGFTAHRTRFLPDPA